MDIDVLYITKLAIYTVLIISLPIMCASFIIGLLVGIFQALTQIQDQTFSFVAKLIIICIVLTTTMNWICRLIGNFATVVYSIKI